MLLRSLIFLCVFGVASAQNPFEKGSPHITNLQSSDYGGEEQNFNFTQDDKGVLYVTNTIGFLEFNGAKWRHFKPDNDGVPISFAKDDEGIIYAGGTSLIGYLEANEQGETKYKSLTHLLPEGFNLEFVWFTVYHNKKIYFLNLKNILVYDGTSIDIIDSPHSTQSMFVHNDTIIVDTANGLYQLKENRLEFIEGTEILGRPDVRALFGDNPETFTGLARGLGMFEYRNNKAQRVNSRLSDFLQEKTVFNATALSDNTIAIATFGAGVVIVDTQFNPLYRISSEGGLVDDLVRSVFQDENKNLWIGTDTGISKINFPIQSTFYKHNAISFGTIQKLTRFKGHLYASSMTGIYKLIPSDAVKILSDKPYAELEVFDPSVTNSFALGSIQDQLLYGGIETTRLSDGNSIKELNNFNPRKFYNSPYHEGRVYLGTKQGCTILQFENGNCVLQKNIDGVDHQIRGVAEDAFGNLWLTTVTTGAYRVKLNDDLDTVDIQHYDLEDGLPSLRDNLAYNIEDEKVIFTTHKGFYEYDYDKDIFIPSSRFGEAYQGTDEFVYAFDYVNKDKAWIHSYRKRESSLYTSSESGYKLDYDPFREFGHIPMYYIYDDSNTPITWFSGPDLVRFDESIESDFEAKNFNAIISQAIIDEDSLIVSGHHFKKEHIVNIDSKFKDIRFEVGATDYYNYERNEYQYFLEGYDKDWSPWTKESFKIYTNLNSGNYTFKVRAKNVFKTFSNEDAMLFAIAPFWYEALWFKLVLAALTILVIAYITNYFSKRKFVKHVHEIELQQKFEDEKNQAIINEQERGLRAMIQAQENERGRIARDLHDGVVQQIGSVILKARKFVEKATVKEKSDAHTFLEDLENSNQELRNISHQMMPRALKDLGMIPAISDMLENSLTYSNIKYQFEHFNIDERLPENIEVTVYRITQELINNIMKHSSANNVNVQLFKADNDIILIVEDDGIGIEKKTQTKGIGLLNISSRVDMMHGTVNFEPSPNSGTLVTVKIPITNGN